MSAPVPPAGDPAPAKAENAVAAARRPGERTFLLALVVFSALALWEAYRISGFTSASGAGVFPMLAAGAMLATSLRLLAGARGPSDGRGAIAALRWLVPPRTLLFVVAAGTFIGLIPWLGFLPVAGAFLFATLAMNWRRGPLASAIVTLALLVVVWLVFRELFQVVLPTGTLWRDWP